MEIRIVKSGKGDIGTEASSGHENDSVDGDFA